MKILVSTLLTFFLILMVPQTNASPLTETFEEEVTLIVDVHEVQVHIQVPVHFLHDFPDFLPLAPQAVPLPELRPPALPLS